MAKRYGVFRDDRFQTRTDCRKSFSRRTPNRAQSLHGRPSRRFREAVPSSIFSWPRCRQAIPTRMTTATSRGDKETGDSPGLQPEFRWRPQREPGSVTNPFFDEFGDLIVGPRRPRARIPPFRHRPPGSPTLLVVRFGLTRD